MANRPAGAPNLKGSLHKLGWVGTVSGEPLAYSQPACVKLLPALVP